MQAAAQKDAAADSAPPAGITVNLNRHAGSWFVAVKTPQALPHWGRALLQGALSATLAAGPGWLRKHFDGELVILWGAIGAVIGFVSSKGEARRATAVVMGDGFDLTIDGEKLALCEVVGCELERDRWSKRRWSIVFRCRTEPAIFALRHLSREQAEFCSRFLTARLSLTRVEVAAGT